MAKYRKMSKEFWSDPYVESLSPNEKLLYAYLFTTPCTNRLGVLAASHQRIAFDNGVTESRIAEILQRFKEDGKIVTDGQFIWLRSFIRHQASFSPKGIQCLVALLKTVESCVIKKAISQRYPHIPWHDGAGLCA